MGEPERLAPLSDDDIDVQIEAIDRLAFVNGRQSVTVDGRRYAQVLEELLALRIAIGCRREPAPQPVGDCPRCSECPGQEHHWNEDVEGRRVGYTCKHCPAWCRAVEDETSQLGEYKPSGIPIAITPEMLAARDEVIALVERHANTLPAEAAMWLLEEVDIDANLKLDAIDDGEIEDFEPVDDEDLSS